MGRGLFVRFALGVLLMGGCASKAPQTLTKSEPYIRSGLAPFLALEETQKFLEWQKGYNIQVKDSVRGIMVTDWIEENPLSRHQFTIRVNRDVAGSIVTVHLNLEQFESNRWRSVIAAPQWENKMISELRNYLMAKDSR